MKKFTITRTSETRFRVESDIYLSDHSFASMEAELIGNRLTPVRGGLSFGYDFHLDLGPVSLAKVQALAIWEAVELTGPKRG